MGQHWKAAVEQLLGSQSLGLPGSGAGNQPEPETLLVRLQDLEGQGLLVTIKPGSVVWLRSQLPAAIA